VTVEDLNFPSAAADNDFMLHISNANKISVRGCSFISGGTSHDGVHMDGHVEDVTISDCYFATGDDAIAVNCPEGYGGDISRVTVTNCTFNGSLSVMRIYTSLDPAAIPTNNVHKARNIHVSNCTGVVSNLCFSLGITNGGLSSTSDPDQIQDLTVTNCTLSSPNGLACLLVPIASITFSDVKFIPTTTGPVFFGWFGPIGEMVLRDVRILRNADGNTAPSCLLSGGSGLNFGKLVLSDFGVNDIVGSSYSAVPCVLNTSGTTIGRLVLDNIDLTHVTNFVDPTSAWGGVTSVTGSGVTSVGPVPDTNLDNGMLYLSSNASGAPSIKVGGTPKRLTLV
jgi:hypothetical protein